MTFTMDENQIKPSAFYTIQKSHLLILFLFRILLFLCFRSMIYSIKKKLAYSNNYIPDEKINMPTAQEWICCLMV